MKDINGVLCFRIIHKSREGVIVEMPMSIERQTKMSWKDFEANFDVVDKVWCTTKTDNESARIATWIGDMLRANPMLMIECMRLKPAEDLATMATVGGIIIDQYELFSKKFPNESMADFMKSIKMCIEAMQFSLNQKFPSRPPHLKLVKK